MATVQTIPPRREMRTSLDPLRAVIYVRVSSDRDKQARSVESQERECRTVCELRGWTVVKVFRDNHRSATRYAKRVREEFTLLEQFIRSGGADVLVTFEASRQQRDLDVYVSLRNLCAERRVHWCYSGRLYDMTNGDDRFSTGVDALVAEREADLIRTRIVRDMGARAEAGGPHGFLPGGYKTVFSADTGKAIARVIDEPFAELLREAAERILAGESAWTIAAEWNARGLTSRRGKPWTGANLVKRLRTPTLAGRQVHHGQVLEGVKTEWEAILDGETFDRLQVLLADPSRRTTRAGGQVKHQGSGIYLCGVCEGPMRSMTRGRKDGSRAYRYDCKAGQHVSRAMAPTDATVDAVVSAFFSRKDVVEELRADPTADAAVAAAQAEVISIKRDLADARAKVRRREITLDDLASFRAQWESDLADAEQRARPRHVPAKAFEIAGKGAAARWAATPVVQRREILRALFSVRILPTSRRDRVFEPELIVVERAPLSR